MMDSRHEFSRATKREAWKRCGGFCEGSGPRYGLPEGKRCNVPLTGRRKIYDHDDPDAFSRDNSLKNCRVVCVTCDGFKTPRDISAVAKSTRIRDKHTGVMPKPRYRWPKRSFASQRYQP